MLESRSESSGLSRGRCLQGLWVHGNLLTSLPDSIGSLSSLKILSAVGNQLTVLPESIGGLRSLTSLELAGNRLSHLPEAIGSLGPYLALCSCWNFCTDTDFYSKCKRLHVLSLSL
jgi:Leucine-rich repeat (LRR) protein